MTRWSVERVGVAPRVLAVLLVLGAVVLAGYLALVAMLIRAVLVGVDLDPLLGCLARPVTSQAVAVSAILAPPADPAAATAATAAGSGGSGLVAQAPIVPVGSVDVVLTNVRNFLLGILVGLATVFATVGGVRWVMSAGDPGEVERAKAALRASLFGFALAALAPLVIEILRGLVSA